MKICMYIDIFEIYLKYCEDSFIVFVPATFPELQETLF